MTSFDHEELRSQLGAYVLGALTSAEQAEVRSHVASCPECAAEVRALQPAVDALALSVDPVDPPPAVRQRVLASIATAPAAAPRVTGSRSLAPWLAAAASLLAAVTLGTYAAQLRGRVQSLEQQLRQAILQVQAGERQTAQARLVAASAQQQLSVLAAPDVRHVDLKGQAIAPDATARALWSRSRGVLLAASNLPALPPGRTYQLWMLNGKNPPTSDGWIFKTDAGGSVTAMFASRPTLPAPVGMAVSIEPDGGSSPLPTGQIYLVGNLN
jgi:anti-sigma-K factor RskA